MKTPEQIIAHITEEIGENLKNLKQVADYLRDVDALAALGYTDADQPSINRALQIVGRGLR